MNKVIIVGLMIAAVLILLRVIVGTPLVQRVAESFQNGGSGGAKMVNSITECPARTQMYMYDGVAFCCSGRLNPDADNLQGTCRPAGFQRNAPPLTFCTLGPSREGIPNCLELRAGQMQAKGESVCPPSMPSYVDGPDGARCCAGAANAELTRCASAKAASCDATHVSNEFTAPGSCAFLRAQQMDPTCPSGYQTFTAQGFEGLTLFGCTDMGQNCYSAATIGRLKELGYDASSLTVCSSGGGQK